MSLRPAKGILALAFLACRVSGCADSGIDREDELGTETGRYELVVLPADSTLAKDVQDQSPEPANIAVFFDPQGEFAVQVGVYEKSGTAEQLVQDLKAQGYPAYGVSSPEGVRVRIGYFATRADAERFGRIFAEDRGVEYWVDRRDAD